MKCSACTREVATKEAQCPFCRRWGTIARWRKVADLERKAIARVSSSIEPLDRLLGGGWVPGCVYRIAGPPGSGKSTLALDVAARLPSIYAAAEESASAIRMRFDRLFSEESGGELLIGEVSAAEEIADLPAEIRFVVVDSLHRLRSPAVAGAAGSNTQLVHAVEVLVGLARKRGLIVLAVSQVNRDGDASGTTGVDHDVDVLLEMARGVEGEAPARLRVVKNRHGPAPASIPIRIDAAGLIYGDEESAA